MLDWWVAGLLFLAASFANGFLGFGFGIIAMAGLAASGDLVHGASLVNLGSVVAGGHMIALLRRSTDWSQVARMYPGLIAGIALGLWLLGSADERALRLLFGASVVGLAGWNLSGLSSGRFRSWLDLPVGALSGVLSGLFNTGGPPLVAHIYRRQETVDTLRGTVQALFLVGGLTRLAGAAATGMLTARVWQDFAVALAFVLAGTAAGVALGRRVAPERFRTASWCALGALGVAIAALG